MIGAYRLPECNDASKRLAEKILAEILSSGVTYAEADDALHAAQDMLAKDTRPVNRGPGGAG